MTVQPPMNGPQHNRAGSQSMVIIISTFLNLIVCLQLLMYFFQPRPQSDGRYMRLPNGAVYGPEYDDPANVDYDEATYDGNYQGTYQHGTVKRGKSCVF